MGKFYSQALIIISRLSIGVILVFIFEMIMKKYGYTFKLDITTSYELIIICMLLILLSVHNSIKLMMRAVYTMLESINILLLRKPKDSICNQEEELEIPKDSKKISINSISLPFSTKEIFDIFSKKKSTIDTSFGSVSVRFGDNGELSKMIIAYEDKEIVINKDGIKEFLYKAFL